MNSFIEKWINLRAFWIALGVGILIAYLWAPQPRVIYKYPTPENAGKVTYVDKAGVCYKYRAREVDCPADPEPMKRH